MNLEQIKEYLDKIDILIDKNQPVPIIQCSVCQEGTIYRKAQRFQCDTCGALSTQFGGIFPYIDYSNPEKKWEDKEWIESCQYSKQFLKVS